ncbi:MAG: hypothetical protein ACI30B_03680 [Paludibacteraceae bacterium]
MKDILKTEVRNANSKYYKKLSNALDYYEKQKQQSNHNFSLKDSMNCPKCKKTMYKSNNVYLKMVGDHVYKTAFNESAENIYIIPICEICNNPNTSNYLDSFCVDELDLLYVPS